MPTNDRQVIAGEGEGMTEGVLMHMAREETEGADLTCTLGFNAPDGAVCTNLSCELF